uniref:Uncharacterized protein n=1 Tax=Anguilla anguilla TaxID=7936 RepID=A0A0E9T2W9_ANGAN
MLVYNYAHSTESLNAETHRGTVISQCTQVTKGKLGDWRQSGTQQ